MESTGAAGGPGRQARTAAPATAAPAAPGRLLGAGRPPEPRGRAAPLAVHGCTATAGGTVTGLAVVLAFILHWVLDFGF